MDVDDDVFAANKCAMESESLDDNLTDTEPAKQMRDIYQQLLNANVERPSQDDEDNETEPISLQTLTPQWMHENDCVFVNVPIIMVNEDETKPHHYIDNMYVMKREKIEEISKIISKVEYETVNEENITVCKNLIELYTSQKQNMNTIKMTLELLNNLLEMSNNRDLEKEFIITNSSVVDFDMIRRYECDEYGLLIDTKPLAEPINGYIYFYSQIPDTVDGQKLRMQIKESCNATDYNEFQYVLSMMRDTLLVRPGRLVSHTCRYVNICLLFCVITSMGTRVAEKSFDRTYNSLVSLLVDYCIRTRLFASWQNNIVTKQLINEIVCNYDKLNETVMMCKQTSWKDRLNLFLVIMKQFSMFKNVKEFQDVHPEQYNKILNDYKIQAEDQFYYFFNTDFLIEFFRFDSFMYLLKNSQKFLTDAHSLSMP
ncbi:gp36-like protein [Phenacoccus solenopsis nudivirus]|nr:gp36-like protein [Phenacoccus solenopsis nudivirus]